MKTHLFTALFFFLSYSLSYSQISTSKQNQTSAVKPSVISRSTALTNGVIYLNLQQATLSSDYVDIPLSFTSPDSIVALDFALKFNLEVLRYESIVRYVPYLTDVLAKYAVDDQTLRFTSNSRQRYIADQAIAVLRFKRTGPIKASDLFGFVGYLNGDKVSTELRGHFPFHFGLLKFWSNNSPIQYDANDPDHYLITTIYSTDSNCSLKSAPVQPDLRGEFIHSSLDKPLIQIERDVLASTNLAPVINSVDIDLALKILINDRSFTPNIYQMIALDVNTDGVISAGDISQISQRSVKTLTEFRQQWNYNNKQVSNGKPSKDWLFLDSQSLLFPTYQISATYPSNDGVGFSKSNVPVIPFCLPAPTAESDSRVYMGVLLGDVNGNYAFVMNDGKIKRMVARNSMP
jgi:hypothetical protein